MHDISKRTPALRMMMLSNRMLSGVPYAEAPKVTMVANNAGTVNSNTWNAGTVNFGPLATGATTRHLILVATCQSDSTVETAADDSSFTITATLAGSGVGIYSHVASAVADTYDSVSGGSVIGIIEDNTNVSGNLTITLSSYSDTMQNYGFILLRAVGLSSSVPTTFSSNTMDVPTNGFGVMNALDFSLTTASCGNFTGSGAILGYAGNMGAAMYRTTSGSVAHSSSGATNYYGATWEFV